METTPFKYLMEIFNSKRFPTFNDDQATEQLPRLSSLLKNYSTLPTFNPSTETDFEDWVDQFALMTSRFLIHPKVGLSYFLSVNELISSYVSERDAIAYSDYERFFNALALKLFPGSLYHRKLRNQLTHPRRGFGRPI